MKKREGISGAREDPQGLGEEQEEGGGRDGWRFGGGKVRGWGVSGCMLAPGLGGLVPSS